MSRERPIRDRALAPDRWFTQYNGSPAHATARLPPGTAEDHRNKHQDDDHRLHRVPPFLCEGSVLGEDRPFFPLCLDLKYKAKVGLEALDVDRMALEAVEARQNGLRLRLQLRGRVKRAVAPSPLRSWR